MRKLADERAALGASLATFDRENAQLNENVVKLQHQLAGLEKENGNKFNSIDQLKRLQASLQQCTNEKCQVNENNLEHLKIFD